MRAPQRVQAQPTEAWALETVGDRITKARKIAGFRTILALHEQTLINRNSLGQYESDEVNPSGAMLTSIALACRVSLHWLRTGEGHPFDGTDRWPDGGSDLRERGSGYNDSGASVTSLRMVA